jgi:multiple sugar transport system permease protein
MIIVLFAVWSLVPVIWMLLASFKTQKEMMNTYELLKSPTFAHYKALIANGKGLLKLLNSLIAASASTVIALVLGSMAGYGLSRARMSRALETNLSFWILSTRMAPVVAVIIPLFTIFFTLGLVGGFTKSMLGLIVGYTTFDLSFSIWMFKDTFDNMDKSIEEAAVLDGCSDFSMLWKIVLPVARPAIVSIGVLCFMFSWNDYIFASILTTPASMTLPVLAFSFTGGQTGIDWGQVMAVGSLAAIPIIVIGILVRKNLVGGLTMGSVK